MSLFRLENDCIEQNLASLGEFEDRELLVAPGHHY